MKFEIKDAKEVSVKETRSMNRSKWAGIESSLQNLKKDQVFVIGDLGLDEDKSLNSVRFSLRQYLKKLGLLDTISIGYCEDGLAVVRR